MNTSPKSSDVYSTPSLAFELEQRLQSNFPWTIGLTCLVALLVYYVFLFLDYPLLSIREFGWNCFVWLMPARLVFSLRPGASVPTLDPSNGLQTTSTEHAAKSEVLRDVFRLSPSLGIGSRAGLSGSSTNVPAGLGNWDNSCYQNSILQALTSLDGLAKFYASLPRIYKYTVETTVGALEDLIDKLKDESNNGNVIWTPAKLKSMSSWQQQDAQEYFSKIMDEFGKDVAALNKMHTTSTQIGDLSSIAQLASDGKEGPGHKSLRRMRSKSNDLGYPDRFANPLDGLLAQRVGCTRCGYVEGLSLIPFNCMTLPLGKEWSYTLADCLDEYTNLEMIDDVECAKCSLLQARHYLRQSCEQLASAPKEDRESVSPLDLQQYRDQLNQRMDAVNQALQDEDFSESTLLQKCRIGRKQRVCSTKSRQGLIMRAPKCLVLHINRSLFDEATGAQLKNYADVRYQETLDIGPWCVGKRIKLDLKNGTTATEDWEMDPARSMAAHNEYFRPTFNRQYRLSAVVTHYGRHENGHYVCYRKSPSDKKPTKSFEPEDSPVFTQPETQQWWRLSDETVTSVSEEEACSQPGAFMLFYEMGPIPYSPEKSVMDIDMAKAVSTPGANDLQTDSPRPLVIDSKNAVSEAESAEKWRNDGVDELPATKPVSELPGAHEDKAVEKPTNDGHDSVVAKEETLPALQQDPAGSSTTQENHSRLLTPPAMRTASDWQSSSTNKDTYQMQPPMVAMT